MKKTFLAISMLLITVALLSVTSAHATDGVIFIQQRNLVAGKYTPKTQNPKPLQGNLPETPRAPTFLFSLEQTIKNQWNASSFFRKL